MYAYWERCGKGLESISRIDDVSSLAEVLWYYFLIPLAASLQCKLTWRLLPKLDLHSSLHSYWWNYHSLPNILILWFSAWCVGGWIGFGLGHPKVRFTPIVIENHTNLFERWLAFNVHCLNLQISEYPAVLPNTFVQYSKLKSICSPIGLLYAKHCLIRLFKNNLANSSRVQNLSGRRI